MKKNYKILFLSVIMSAVIFTGCIDYVDTRLPPYPESVSPEIKQFGNVVSDKIWYTRARSLDNNTTVQTRLTFNPDNFTFKRETFIWDNIAGGKHNNRRVDTMWAKYGCKATGNNVIDIRYIKTDSDYNRIDSNTYELQCVIENADIVNFNGVQHVSKEALDGQVLPDYTELETW